MNPKTLDEVDMLGGSGGLIILGAKGQLGRELARQVRHAGVENVLGYGRPELDVTDAGRLHKMVAEARPACVINCAALTNVDACELEPDKTIEVNARPVAVLAEVCNSIGATLVQLSTDFVFDGSSTTPYREEDPTGPLNVYGRAKLVSEEHARNCQDHLIIRTAWLFGPGTGNFVARMLGRAMAGQKLRIVNDRWGSPTYSPDLAAAILKLVRVHARGTYHVVNTGQASWYELAKTAVEIANLDVSVEPIDSSQYSCPAERPAHSELDTRRYQEATGGCLRNWRDALKDYIASGTWMPAQV